MSVDFIVGIMAETIRITLMISAPVLLVGLVVGVAHQSVSSRYAGAGNDSGFCS